MKISVPFFMGEPMAAPPLSKSDLRNISGLLNAASSMMAAAWNAHGCGLFGPEMRDAVLGVQQDMGRFLAYFEDGAGYGQADPGSVATMRNIEAMASHLIEDTEPQHEAA